MPGQIKVDPPPHQVGNSRDSTGRSGARRWDGHHTRWCNLKDNPGRWNGSSAEDCQETSNHSDSQRSQWIFNDRLMSLTQDYDAIILVFDTYTHDSLKSATKLRYWRKPFLRHPFCKIQDGGHKGLGANGNIVFLIAYAIMFPKMYSFHTLHKNPTKVKIGT